MRPWLAVVGRRTKTVLSKVEGEAGWRGCSASNVMSVHAVSRESHLCRFVSGGDGATRCVGGGDRLGSCDDAGGSPLDPSQASLSCPEWKACRGLKTCVLCCRNHIGRMDHRRPISNICLLGRSPCPTGYRDGRRAPVPFSQANSSEYESMGCPCGRSHEEVVSS